MNDGDSLFVALLCAGDRLRAGDSHRRLVPAPAARSGSEQRAGAAGAAARRLRPRRARPRRCCGACSATRRSTSASCWCWSGAISGAIWGLDQAFFARRRKQAAAAAGTPPERVREPIAVEYARSFFPVILLVLVIRSFLFEPFRIPSDSMMPTLFDGDFIFVSKYSYGLRLPVTNTLIIPTGTPAAGRCDRVPPAAESQDQLHQAAGGTARATGSGSTRRTRLYVNGVLQPQTPGPVYTRTQAECLELCRACRRRASSWAAKRHQIMFARGGGEERGVGGPGGPLFLHGRQPQQQQGQSLDGRFGRPGVRPGAKSGG